MTLSTRRGFIYATALLSALSAIVVFSFSGNADYHRDAGPSIDALLDGDLSRFMEQQPVMGSLSIFLRVPFAALARALDPTKANLEFQIGALACLIVASITGLIVAREMASRARPSRNQVVVALLFVLNPLTFSALTYGHPEELVGASLCVLAVLVALRDRALLCGLLLGLALATKQWAVVAVFPVLIALPHRRARATMAAVLVAALFWLPFVAGNFNAFRHTTESAVDVRNVDLVTAPNVWAPFSRTKLVDLQAVDDNAFNEGPALVHEMPTFAGIANRPLIVFLPVAMSLLFLWIRRHNPVVRSASKPEDVLALLALVLLLRCLFDPLDTAYYHVPFLMALLSFQGLRQSSFPYLSVIVVAALSVSDVVSVHGSFSALAFVYLTWALPLAALLGILSYRPDLVATGRRSVKRLISNSRLAPFEHG